MSNEKCLLSVAMIVKDEEHNIKRALESLKGVADEIVVVDTGSTDRTPEIVKEYTDKLYFHEWRNDFSEARNYSLKFPTCEWVLIFDADEELSEETRRDLREFLKKLPRDVNTVYVPTLSYLDWSFKKQEIASTPRIFRNGTVYYRNAVHNQPVYKPKIAHFKGKIIHYGYIWTRALKKKKYQRTRNLILDFLKKCKDPAEKLYYLVQLYKTETISGKDYLRYRVGWQILSELKKTTKVTNILFEFLYMFGAEAVMAGYYGLGEDLLKKAIEMVPFYPDPYFGMMMLYERKREWEKVIEYGEKYFKSMNDVLNRSEEFKWTIITLKELGTANGLMAHAYLKLKNPKKAKEYLKGFFEEASNSTEKILQVLIADIGELENPDLLNDSLDIFRELIEFAVKMRYRLNAVPALESYIEHGVEIPKSILERIPSGSFWQILLVRRLKEGKDLLLEYFLRGKSEEDFLKENGAQGLLFLYETKENDHESIMRFLNLSRKLPDLKVQGISLAFMGDNLLKDGKFKEAIAMYKKSIEKLPELSNFVKPVIEDLKTRLDPETEGVADEVFRYFNQKKEMIYDFVMKYPRIEISKLHLISDNPLAYYLSAVNTSDPKKSRELLLKIRNKSRFPFYYYRLAKTYEDSDKFKAFEIHIKACEENPTVGDLKDPNYKFTDFYPMVHVINPSDGETMWVGNITENFSTFGVIHPVRMWKKIETYRGFISYPFPADEALNLFFEREKQRFGKHHFMVNREHLLKVLAGTNWNDVSIHQVYGDREMYDSVFEELGIEVHDNSKRGVILNSLETTLNLKDLLEHFDEVLLFFWSPDLKNRRDLVWSYPPFRVLRTTKDVKEELNELGFSSEMVLIEGSLRCLKASRKHD